MALSNVPKVVDFECYAGDSFAFTVTVPAGVVDGLEWKAQLRRSPTSTTIDASFTIVPPAVSGGPAGVSLTAADTARLGGYYGVYDVQVAAPGGGDPVTTLLRGQFTIERDVSR